MVSCLDWNSRPHSNGRLMQAVQRNWVVYAKRPFGGPQQVLRYLARYTHRVAISDHRLLELKDGQVRFQYKDYADGQQSKDMTLSSSEFIRRFLMHTLPSRFVRIRYFGFLANRFRKQRLDQCRILLGMRSACSQVSAQRSSGELDEPQAKPKCPACGGGRILIVDIPSISARRPSPSSDPPSTLFTFTRNIRSFTTAPMIFTNLPMTVRTSRLRYRSAPILRLAYRNSPSALSTTHLLHDLVRDRRSQARRGRLSATIRCPLFNH